VRRTTASKMVVAAWSIMWQWLAKGWPELADAVGFMSAILARSLTICCGVLQRRGGIYRGAGVGEELGFGGVLGSDGGGNVHARAELRWGKVVANKRGPLVSGSAVRGTYRFGCETLAGPGPLLGLGQLVPRNPFTFF
jgi:hypothetical protein